MTTIVYPSPLVFTHVCIFADCRATDIISGLSQVALTGTFEEVVSASQCLAQLALHVTPDAMTAMQSLAVKCFDAIVNVAKLSNIQANSRPNQLQVFLLLLHILYTYSLCQLSVTHCFTPSTVVIVSACSWLDCSAPLSSWALCASKP